MEEEPTKEKNPFLFVGVVILLAAVIAGAFFYFNRFRLEATKQASLEPTPTEAVTPTTEPTPEPTEKPLSGTMTIKLFFGNSELNPKEDCRKVFPVSREIPRTLSVAKAALNLLFAGPTASEKAKGYTSFFSVETKGVLKSVKVVEGVAYVNLADIRSLIPNASTSCGSTQFLAEMESTLKQFPTVKKVIFAVDGQPQTFYDFLQIGCAKENNDCDSTPFK